MDESQALLSFAALAGDTRLRIVGRLVRAGPKGMAAGEIAESLKVSPSNMSFHLKELERARLVTAHREARSIIYAADYGSLRGLIQFLMRDCCADRPEICAPRLAGADGPPARTRKRADA
jgi:DNA-binding transcriptional ArsR family regulator